jgi:hypothetical protein
VAPRRLLFALGFHAQSPIFFSNLHVFLVLPENLEAAVEHLTMEILLNLSSSIVCSCCYLVCVDNGKVEQILR